MSYIQLGYRPRNDVVCDFYLEPSGGLSVKDVSEQVAAESSVGTWTKVHTERPYMKSLRARVFSIKGNNVRIAYPLGLFEPGNIPQLLSSVAGNIFGMKAVKNLRLENIQLPGRYVKSFRGPRFGIRGVRKILSVKKRPLLGTIIKPKLGLKTRDHARVAYEAWVGGCDVVKDDENLSGQKFNPFEKRVVETLKMRNRAEKETGEKKVYMPNVTAEIGEMLRRARFVKEHGGRYVMVDIVTCGFSSLQALREQDLDLVLHGHRAMHASFTRNKKHGISMLVLAKLARLVGMDQLHIGTVIGKMEGDRTEVVGIRDSIIGKWFGLRETFPVCSGGLAPRHIPKLVSILGKDIIIQMGGGIHGNPKGTRAGAMEARNTLENL